MIFPGVLGHAFEDPVSTPAHLLRLSKSVYEWLLPVRYHSLCFTQLDQIVNFVGTHDRQDQPLTYHLSLVRSLWMGGTNHGRSDLATYTSNPNQNAGAILTHLVYMCKSLERLILLYLRPYQWRHFEWIIPSSLKYLTLGPGPAPFSVDNLSNKPQLREFTSVFAVVGKKEFEDLVHHPSLQRIRNITWEGDVLLSFEGIQEHLSCIRNSSRRTPILEYMFAPTGHVCDIDSARSLLNVEGIPKIIVKCLETEHWLDLLFNEFTAARYAFIAGQSY